MSAYDWMDGALCAQTDPELFHRDGNGNTYRQAKAICAGCPVQRDCEDFADSFEGALADRHGLYGGVAPRGRANRATERARAERDALIVRLTQQGGRTVTEIATLAGCDERTVHRVTAAHRQQHTSAA